MELTSVLYIYCVYVMKVCERYGRLLQTRDVVTKASICSITGWLSDS